MTQSHFIFVIVIWNNCSPSRAALPPACDYLVTFSTTYLNNNNSKKVYFFISTVGGCVGTEAGGGTREDAAAGAGVRGPQGGPGCPAQEAHGGPRDQDEANHHPRRTVEKGETCALLFWEKTRLSVLNLLMGIIGRCRWLFQKQLTSN